MADLTFWGAVGAGLLGAGITVYATKKDVPEFRSLWDASKDHETLVRAHLLREQWYEKHAKDDPPAEYPAEGEIERLSKRVGLH